MTMWITCVCVIAFVADDVPVADGVPVLRPDVPASSVQALIQKVFIFDR